MEKVLHGSAKIVLQLDYVAPRLALEPQPNDRNIVGYNMLRAFGHLVATCCGMLGVDSGFESH